VKLEACEIGGANSSWRRGHGGLEIVLRNSKGQIVEFERYGPAGTSSISSQYFDLLIRLKSEQEHQFCNINSERVS